MLFILRLCNAIDSSIGKSFAANASARANGT